MDYMFGNQELSSGCDSGWTLYLQHSSIPPHASYDPQLHSPNRVSANDDDDEEEEEEDEDLSMVSDASSGPPHLHEEEEDKNGCSFYPYAAAIDEPLQLPTNVNLTRKKKKRENRCRNKLPQHHSSLLDDTASSPFLDFCNETRSQTSVENVVEYSQGYSTTQFEERERSPCEEGQYDFFQSGNQLQQHNQWFEGKRW